MEETISTLPETTSEASKHTPVIVGTSIVGYSEIVEYTDKRSLDTSGMTARGQKFFASCPG